MDKGHSRVLFRRALDSIANKQYAAALTLLDELERDSPERRHIMAQRVVSLRGLGRTEEANDLAKRLTERFGNGWEAELNREDRATTATPPAKTAGATQEAGSAPTNQMGTICPQCGFADAKLHYPPLKWIPALLTALLVPFALYNAYYELDSFGPVLLLALGLTPWLLPWRRCVQCGCVYHPRWLKPATPPSAEADLCWFCGMTPAEPLFSVNETFYKGKEEEVVVVPRCAICSAAHSAPARCWWFGGILSLLMQTAFPFVCLTIPVLAGLVWYGGKYFGGKLAAAKLAAAGLTSKPRPEYAHHPAVNRLLLDGWKNEPPKTKRVEEIRPKSCPRCGARTAPGSFMLHLSNTIGPPDRSSVAQRCQVCGKWGCRLCMHYHLPDGSIAWKGTSAPDGHGNIVYHTNVTWIHNGCCTCDWGMIEGGWVSGNPNGSMNWHSPHM
ncbi:MAG: hypothetical protein RBU21_13935 [FCB group bacterium]|nr:hypothetical protein [FCB group bacterium]